MSSYFVESLRLRKRIQVFLFGFFISMALVLSLLLQTDIEDKHLVGLFSLSNISMNSHCSLLGLGKFCVELCRDIPQSCIYEPHRRTCDLDPYDHLQRFFRVCIVHFKRNIQPLKHGLPHDVIEAMYSIASAEPHINFDVTLAKICNGGAKAKGMSCML